MADILRAFELCAKAVRSVVGGLVDCDVRRPHVGADALADKEAEEEAGEPVSFYTESYGDKAVRILVDRDVDGSWWSAEAVKARARVETPLSATFTDELDDISLSRQRFLDEQHGPDRICIFCFGKRSECTHSYQEMFAPKTSDAAGATVASVEDPSPDVPPASGEADSGVLPAIKRVLAQHLCVYDEDAVMYECCDGRWPYATHARFGDEKDWREHVAPLIAAAVNGGA